MSKSAFCSWKQNLRPYTPAVVVGNHVWLSGQINIDAGDDIVSQPKAHSRKSTGYSLKQMRPSTTDVDEVLLKTMDFYAPMNEVGARGSKGRSNCPSGVCVDALPADALVEIVVHAVKSD